MQDRFKFRIWDKKQKRFITPYLFSLGASGEIKIEEKLGKTNILYKYEDDYTLMQSTGLKDKNGKLIYEGDIVKCPAFSEDTYIIDYSFGEYFCNINGRYGSGYSIQVITEHHSDFIEIIGNRYENPELLIGE